MCSQENAFIQSKQRDVLFSKSGKLQDEISWIFWGQLTFPEGGWGENKWVLDDSALRDGEEHIGGSLEVPLVHDRMDGLWRSPLWPLVGAPEGDSVCSSLTLFAALSTKGWKLELESMSFFLEDGSVLTLGDPVPSSPRVSSLWSRVLAFSSFLSLLLPSTSPVEATIFLEEAGILKWFLRPIVTCCLQFVSRRGEMRRWHFRVCRVLRIDRISLKAKCVWDDSSPSVQNTDTLS